MEFPSGNIGTLLAAARELGFLEIITVSDDNPGEPIDVAFEEVTATEIPILTEQAPDHFLTGPQADESTTFNIRNGDYGLTV